MTFQLRPAESESDTATMSAFSMLTIWETIPEARIDPSTVPNFSHETMVTMYRAELDNPQHRYLVARDEEGALVGHTIYQLSADYEEVLFGYLYTRYVLPAYRRRGLGGRMLDGALEWFRQQGAVYAKAHTHPTNAALQGLFASRGFEQGSVIAGSWPSLVLRKPLQ